MLSRVTKHTRRRSVRESSEDSQETPVMVVDRPPDLVRWDDFSEPFPTVARGGYARFYAAAARKAKTTEAPNYCPLLYQSPCNAEIPRKTPLFLLPRPPPRMLSTICESSSEHPPPQRPTNLKITTGSPTSLRRRRRYQLLRTPSIERDFAAYRRHIFSSTAVPTPTAPTVHSSSESDSSHSSSETSFAGSDSHAQLVHSPISPVTPPTSADSEDELGDSVYIRALYKEGCIDGLGMRPNSRASFSTAKTEFSED